MKRTLYLDYNASAPLLEKAREAMIEALDYIGNPSSVHEHGRKVRYCIDKARNQIADCLHADPEHILFTSSASEAASFLLQPVWKQGQMPVPIGSLFICSADHPCFLSGGSFPKDRIHYFSVDRDGVVDFDSLISALDGHDPSTGKAMVCLHMVNNETGVIQPISLIGEQVHRREGIFIVDAVQAMGRIPVNLESCFLDHLVISSHKIGGPKGAGAVVSASHKCMPYPLIRGGKQEGGYRAGTENVPALAGFGAAACEISGRLERMNSVLRMCDGFENILKDLCPDVIIYGNQVSRVGNTILFSIPSFTSSILQIEFDLAGISLSSGAACSSGSVGSSHVLRAMGFSSFEPALRLSIGEEIEKEDLSFFHATLSDILKKQKKKIS